MKRHTKRRTLTLAVAVLSVILAINISGFVLLITVPSARYRHNINLGHYYLVQLDYDGALRAYSNAIDIDPKKSDAYQGLSWPTKTIRKSRISQGKQVWLNA